MTPPHIFLEGWSRALLLLHALVALALAGAATHLAVVSLRLWRSALQAPARARLARLARIYAQVIGATYAAAFGLGLLMYPHYRYVVRALYLDRYDVWAANLFDIKENLAALGLPLAIAVWAVGRKLDPERDRALAGWLAFLAVSIWLLVGAATISGLLVTDVRGV